MSPAIQLIEQDATSTLIRVPNSLASYIIHISKSDPTGASLLHDWQDEEVFDSAVRAPEVRSIFQDISKSL